MGDPVLRLLSKNIESLGISKNTFNIVYEGFWDLYCKKPATGELNVRKLEGWINRINLVSNGIGPSGAQEGEQEEGKEENEEEEKVAENEEQKESKPIEI